METINADLIDQLKQFYGIEPHEKFPINLNHKNQYFYNYLRSKYGPALLESALQALKKEGYKI